VKFLFLCFRDEMTRFQKVMKISIFSENLKLLLFFSKIKEVQEIHIKYKTSSPILKNSP